MSGKRWGALRRLLEAGVYLSAVLDSCGGIADVYLDTHKGICSQCAGEVLFGNSLRLHEPFMDNGENQTVLNRLMNGVEHFLMLHYVLYLREVNPKLLSQLCIISDGPLALFGEVAPLHRGIMKILGSIRKQQNADGLQEPLMLGFSKSGRVVEHFAAVEGLIADVQGPSS